MTLKELARRAGVHPSTVSRVLNDDPDVRLSSNTRQRVLELADETGYRPNRVARSLKRRRTLVLGVLVPDITNPLFASMFRGVEDVAFERGYHALLCSTDDHPDRVERLLYLVAERQVDGVILATASRYDAAVARLNQRGEAFVLLNRRSELFQDRFVVGDDERGAELATAHLLSLGRRRVAHLAGRDEAMTGYLRRRGYRRALEQSGTGYDPSLVVETDFTEAGGYRSACRLLAAGRPPDAIFAVNDMAAIGALDALAQHGLSVPGDVALVGFNDVPLAARISPALSSVRVPHYDMGATAAHMLIDLLADRAAPPPVGRILESRLVIRASSGGPISQGSAEAQTCPAGGRALG